MTTTQTHMVTAVMACSHLDSEAPLSAEQLAHACRTSVQWVYELVECGVIATVPAAAPSAGAHQGGFGSTELTRALAARHLQNVYEVNLDAAALILDLQQEVRRLRTQLRANGLGEP